MQKHEFRNYLLASGKSNSTANNRVSNCQNIENYYGDLVELYNSNKIESILEEFEYTINDERENKKQNHKVLINGDIRSGSATLKNALKLYFDFKLSLNFPDEGTYSTIENAVATNFRLESDLENTVFRQISTLFPEYREFNHKGKKGKQFVIPNDISKRIIDILLEHKVDNHLLVIEMKGKEISRETFGQISEYLVLLQEYFPDKKIKGCLIGNDIGDNLQKIVNSSKYEISLKKYDVEIKLQDI